MATTTYCDFCGVALGRPRVDVCDEYLGRARVEFRKAMEDFDGRATRLLLPVQVEGDIHFQTKDFCFKCLATLTVKVQHEIPGKPL